MQFLRKLGASYRRPELVAEVLRLLFPRVLHGSLLDGGRVQVQVFLPHLATWLHILQVESVMLLTERVLATFF